MSIYNPSIGGGIIEFVVAESNPWPAGNYAGIGPEAPDASPNSVLAWPAPGPGLVSDLALQGDAYNNTGGDLDVTVFKAAAGLSPTFNLTTLSARVKASTAQGYDADASHAFHVDLGDLLVVKLVGLGTWGGGQVITMLWKPD